MRHVEKPTHTIVGLPDAPSPVDWHSENEIAQATAASLAARGDVEDAPIAGVSTSRVENTRPYFVWNPEVARQEHAPEARQSNLSASGDMTEYMQRFRAFTVTETVTIRFNNTLSFVTPAMCFSRLLTYDMCRS